MSSLPTSDVHSDDDASLLEEDMPDATLRRVSSSSSSSSNDSSFARDEAGLITTRHRPLKSGTPVPSATSADASTIVRALDNDSFDSEDPLTPKDVNSLKAVNGLRKPSRALVGSVASNGNSTSKTTRQNLTLREQEKVSSLLVAI